VQVNPEEIKEIKVIGRLFDNDVKLVKTIGGFLIAIGKKTKFSKSAEALAAGNHPAIVAHHIQKTFGSDFHPAMFKSEADRLESVEEKTNLLPSDAIQKGMKLFTLSKDHNYTVVLEKHGLTLGEYTLERNAQDLVIKNNKFNTKALSTENKSALAQSIAAAIEDTAAHIGVERIVRK
jgi:hypothetical protein